MSGISILLLKAGNLLRRNPIEEILSIVINYYSIHLYTINIIDATSHWTNDKAISSGKNICIFRVTSNKSPFLYSPL